jgi:hypothetical protein
MDRNRKALILKRRFSNQDATKDGEIAPDIGGGEITAKNERNLRNNASTRINTQAQEPIQGLT